MKAVIFSLLLVVGITAQASESHVKCRGSEDSVDLLFNYDIYTSDDGAIRTHLTLSRGYNKSEDFGWRNSRMNNHKVIVDSPWSEYTTILRQTGNLWELLLLDPKTGVQINEAPYDHFTCVPRPS